MQSFFALISILQYFVYFFFSCSCLSYFFCFPLCSFVFLAMHFVSLPASLPYSSLTFSSTDYLFAFTAHFLCLFFIFLHAHCLPSVSLAFHYPAHNLHPSIPTMYSLFSLFSHKWRRIHFSFVIFLKQLAYLQQRYLHTSLFS